MKVLITFTSEYGNMDFVAEMTEAQFNVVKHAHGKWDGVDEDAYSFNEYDALTALNIALTSSKVPAGEKQIKFADDFSKRVGVEFRYSMWADGYVPEDEPVNLKDVDYYIRYGFAG